MKHSSFLTGVLSFLLFCGSGCAAKTLDGGSTGNPNGASSSSGANAGGNGAIADQPLAGTIAGQPFEAKASDITFSKRNNQWFLSFDSYANDCGSLGPTPPPPDTSMTINVGALEAAAGTFTIAYGDGHAASLQLGVYSAGDERKADVRSVRDGTLRLDAWDETPGATITGAIKLVADEESAVEGTFTAKVCPAR